MSDHEAPAPARWKPTPATRAWLYRVTNAAAVLAAGYGYISGDKLPLWLALGAAVFGTGLAAANTTTKKEGNG